MPQAPQNKFRFDSEARWAKGVEIEMLNYGNDSK